MASSVLGIGEMKVNETQFLMLINHNFRAV